jgi:glucose-6-phosphate 1-dehydrogenase
MTRTPPSPPTQTSEVRLYDATMRDPSLFKRADMIEGGWTIVQPILDTWASGRGGILHKYSGGSEEPAAAGEMLERDGRRWKDIRI